MSFCQAPVFVYYDLETTGFSPSLHRICQIAFVLPKADQLQKFCSLVNPDGEIPSRAREVHGISTELARQAPFFGQVWSQACDWLQSLLGSAAKVCLVGHNSWRFDDLFLQAETARCKHRLSDLAPNGCVWSMDTLVMYRQHRQSCFRNQKPPKESLRLGDLYKSLIGVELVGAHDALVDCMAVAEVHNAILKLVADKQTFLQSCLRHLGETVHPTNSFQQALDRLDHLRCPKRPRVSGEMSSDPANEPTAVSSSESQLDVGSTGAPSLTESTSTILNASVSQKDASSDLLRILENLAFTEKKS